jgi:hypothetical protein
MKSMTKKTFFAMALFTMGLLTNIKAADLVVAEGGAGGAYSSISQAITAAVNGDRILINPKSGNSAYAENLTIDKNLQLLCNIEGAQFTVQGNVNITPANDRVVTIIGMKDLVGTIDGTTNCSAGLRCKVYLLNCTFLSGNVNFDYNNYNLTLASSIVNGNVTLRYGKVLGNQITATGSGVKLNADTYLSNDTNWVVGNKIVANIINSAYYAGIYNLNTSQFFYFSNNYITFGTNYNNGYPACGIYVTGVKNSSNGRNTIFNNTITRGSNTGGWNNNARYGISVSGAPASTYVDIMNNIILGLGYGIDIGIDAGGSSGVVSSSYAFMNGVTTPFSVVANDGTNNLATNVTLDAEGRPAVISDVINAGNSDSTYYDIDLTRNDVGCYGGSFTLDNYFPFTGSARVYFMLVPRRITVGNTLNIKAESFDK